MRAGGSRARRRRASSPASRRSTRAAPARTSRRTARASAAARPSRPAAGPAVRREQHLEAEHVVPVRAPSSGRRSTGTLTSSAGRSSTPPGASSGRRVSISASVGAIVSVDDRSQLAVAQPRLAVDDGVDLRLVALGRSHGRPAGDHRRARRPAGGAATRTNVRRGIAGRDDDRCRDLGAVGERRRRRTRSPSQQDGRRPAQLGAQLAAVVRERSARAPRSARRCRRSADRRVPTWRMRVGRARRARCPAARG